jgi:pimeloyl-ACP methyl ester carboxylesterase
MLWFPRGFGFSDRPSIRGMNVFRVAELWAALMIDLGYARFAAQGGDIGAGVGTRSGIASCRDRIGGLRLNFSPGSYLPHLEGSSGLTPVEEEFLRSVPVGRREWRLLAYSENAAANRGLRVE